jgi:hypothetical protein
MSALDAKLATQKGEIEGEITTLTTEETTVTTEKTQLDEAKTEYDTSSTIETELSTETTTAQNKEAEQEAGEKLEVLAVVAEEKAEEDLDEEDKADVTAAKQEEEVKERKIVAEANAANAQVIRNSLNSYYKTIVKQLAGAKFDGTQDLQILAKINTTEQNGTLFAHAFPAKWGAKWESGGNGGQGKMLFLRGGRLCFDIGWVGVITGKTMIADGKDHTIGLRFNKIKKYFELWVDGKKDASGLRGVKDRDGATFLIGVSVGHDERRVASMAPMYRGKIWDFRINFKSTDFDTAITKQKTDVITDGSDGKAMSGGSMAKTETVTNEDGTSVTTITIGTTITTKTTDIDGKVKVKTRHMTKTTSGSTSSSTDSGKTTTPTSVDTNTEETNVTGGDDDEEEGSVAVYKTVKVKQADGTVVEETVVEGEEEEETDDQVAEEINTQIAEVEVMKETASEATEMTEKLVKEEIDAKKTKEVTEKEEADADEANQKAEEDEADAQLEEENVQVEIDEKEEKIEKTDNALEKADLQEKLDDAKEKKKKIIIRRSKCYYIR